MTPDPPHGRGPITDTTGRSQPAPSRRGLWLRLLLSLAITAAVVALVAREWGAVPDDLRVPTWAVPAYLGTLVLYFFARAGRFWFLVRPLGRVGFVDLLHVAFAGFLWILLLPWRLGQFVRPQLLAQVARAPDSPPVTPHPHAPPSAPSSAPSSPPSSCVIWLEPETPRSSLGRGRCWPPPV